MRDVRSDARVIHASLLAPSSDAQLVPRCSERNRRVT
jgi:hypothetical protein